MHTENSQDTLGLTLVSGPSSMPVLTYQLFRSVLFYSRRCLNESEPLYTLAPRCGSAHEQNQSRFERLQRPIVQHGEKWCTWHRIDIGLGRRVEPQYWTVLRRSSSCFQRQGASLTRASSNWDPPSNQEKCGRMRSLVRSDARYNTGDYDGELVGRHSEDVFFQRYKWLLSISKRRRVGFAGAAK